jgi:hypothetical protein
MSIPGDKFTADDNDAGDRVSGMSMDAFFMAVRLKLSAAVSDFDGRINRRFGLK